MRARFARAWAKASRANLAGAVGVLLSISGTHSASAALATPEQRKACTPDVYRLGPGEIPNVRGITSCGGRKRTGPARRCLSSEGGEDLAVQAAIEGSNRASSQIGTAQAIAQINVVTPSTGRNWVKVAIRARQFGWAPANDTAFNVE